MKNFWRAMQVFGILSSWLAEASADGKITSHELADLVNMTAPTLGFKVEIEIPVDSEGETFSVTSTQ